MAVKSGDRIAILYTGTLDDGTVFDSSDMHDGEPLEFIVGSHQVIPGFEDGVLGMEIGEERQIHIDVDNAYGPYQDELIKDFPKAEFPPDLEVEIGMTLGLATPEGYHIPAIVKEILEEIVKLDLNHPLAGKALNFKLSVKEILEEGCDCSPECGSCCGGCGHDHEEE